MLCISNPAVVDKYWTVEIAFPFKSLAYPIYYNYKNKKIQKFKNTTSEYSFIILRYLQTNITVPPQPKDQWRINFSRVEYHVTVVDGRFEKV